MTRNSRLVALASNHLVIDCPTVVPDNPKEWLMINGVKYILMDEIYSDSINFVNALTAGQNEPPGLIARFQIGYTAVIEITPELFFIR